MTQSFNFNDLLNRVKDAGGSDDVLPPGDYQATVLEAEAAVAASGNPYIKAKFEVNSGPHKGTWARNNFVLAVNSDKGDAALKPFFRQMGVLGVTEEVFRGLSDLEAAAALIVGKSATIKTAVREWQGKKQVDVKSVSAPQAIAGAVPGVPQVGTPVPQVPTISVGGESTHLTPVVPTPQVAAAPPTPAVQAPTTLAGPPPAPF